MNTAALLAGGVWAYWKFVWQREREPRAEFDVTAEFLGVQDGKWLGSSGIVVGSLLGRR